MAEARPMPPTLPVVVLVRPIGPDDPALAADGRRFLRHTATIRARKA